MYICEYLVYGYYTAHVEIRGQPRVCSSSSTFTWVRLSWLGAVVNTSLADSEVFSCFSVPGSHLATQEQELEIHKPHLTFTRALGIQAWILHSKGFTHWFNSSAHHPSILVNVFTSKIISPRMGMIVHPYNPNTQETKSRVTQDQGLPRLYSKILSPKKKILFYGTLLN